MCRHSVPNEQIAILTPYSAQKEEIKERLKQRREQQKRQRTQQQKQPQQQRILGDVLVKTITESQGISYKSLIIAILYRYYFAFSSGHNITQHEAT